MSLKNELFLILYRGIEKSTREICREFVIRYTIIVFLYGDRTVHYYVMRNATRTARAIEFAKRHVMSVYGGIIIFIILCARVCSENKNENNDEEKKKKRAKKQTVAAASTII